MKMNPGISLLLLMCFQPCICQMCSSYSRLPENYDLTVECRTTDIKLSINVCPVYFANFLPSELALNGKHNSTECSGIMDNSTNPPVLNFTLQLDGSKSNVCGYTIEIMNEVGTGSFSQYSNVQKVTISGYVDSLPLTEMGTVSYSTNLYYSFSCHYPLQYFLNNTQLLTSFGSVAVNTNNGSFLSTLRMHIFTDGGFTTESTTNTTVYELKKNVYVQVSSNNSAMSYNVYLDRCFATPSPIVSNLANDSYAFFTGCDVQNRTTIISNGQSTVAKFSFETFRFVQHNGQKTSSIYLHCMTRLCQYDQCPKCTGSRRKRDVNANTEQVMVSSGPLYVVEERNQEDNASNGGTCLLTENHSGLAVGLIIAVIIRMWP